jgi:hypothetical protein
MRELAFKAKNAVIQEIRLADPSPQSIRMHCFTVDKQSHLNLVLRNRRDYGSTHRLYDPVDSCIGTEINRATSDSMTFFDVNWAQIPTEADNDTEQILKKAGLKVKPAGPAHQLADVVAWTNYRSMSLPNVRHSDLVSTIDSRLRRRLRL